LFVVKRNESVGGTDKPFLFVRGAQITARNAARTSNPPEADKSLSVAPVVRGEEE
jgi:hypothetical protein